MPKAPSTNYQPPAPKIAIAHDWLVGGGAEQVVLELHKLYPDAPIYTSYCTDEWRNKLDNKVNTGYLQYLGKFRKFLPLLQYLWFRYLNLNDYDVVISSSGNGMSKAVKKGKNAIHINYCHTPVHYLWRHYDQYLARPGFGIFDPIARIGLKILLKPLQKLDYKAAQDVDKFIANSNHIKNDIKKYYNKDASVIFPPVDTSRFTANRNKRSGYVTVGRLVPMKQTELIVEACNDLSVPLTVVGHGPEYENLKNIAGPTIKILGKASNSTVEAEMSKAEAFIFASYEDFGITPIEAMAAGTPVLAFGKGGALDYISPDTGILFKNQSVEDIVEAIKSSQNIKWDHAKIAKTAQKFSKETFRQNITRLINQKIT